MNHLERITENELHIRYKKYQEIIKSFTIMSDTFMRNVLKDQSCTEYILRIIMEKEDLQVVHQILQHDYKNLQGRSAILDCVVRDAEDRHIDIEIQQEKEGASPKRARYHSSLMDMNILKAGQSFDELPESYIIFITRDDVIGYDFPIYHIKRTIEEVKTDFCDESYIIYVNSKIQDDTALGRLMHDLNCADANEMYSSILAKRVRELKETQEGVDQMCQEMDKIYSEGIKLGEKRGEKRGMELGEIKAKKETVLSLAEMGLSVESISQAVKENISLVQKWILEGGLSSFLCKFQEKILWGGMPPRF